MPELRVEGAVFKPRLSYRYCRYIISGLEGRQGPASQRGELLSRRSLGPKARWELNSRGLLTSHVSKTARRGSPLL